MAIGNLLTKGSYSKVESIFFDEKMRSLRFRLNVYQSSEKKSIVSSMDYVLDPAVLAHRADPDGEADLGAFQKAFDDNFSSKALSKSGNNLYKAIYKFLKSLEEMSGTKNV